MSCFQRFESMDALQKARELTKSIYAMSNDGQSARDFGLCDQQKHDWQLYRYLAKSEIKGIKYESK